MTQNKPSDPLKKALVVTVNGEKVWSLGADIESLDVGLVCLDGSREMFILTGSGVQKKNHLRWDLVHLQWGDVISIRMTECSEVDPPDSRRTFQEAKEARSRLPKEESGNDDMPPLPAPWE